MAWRGGNCIRVLVIAAATDANSAVLQQTCIVVEVFQNFAMKHSFVGKAAIVDVTKKQP